MALEKFLSSLLLTGLDREQNLNLTVSELSLEMTQYQQSILCLQLRLRKAGETMQMFKLMEKLMQMSLLQDLLVELVLHYLL